MEIRIGAAKVAKYAAGESGDTLEMIERPHGGLSVVLVDGQRSGPSAKIISNIVARKTISLLGEGVRDGAAARAAHDYLRTHRRGQVSAELQLLSVDLFTRSLVLSRNTHCPALIWRDGQLDRFDDETQPIGIYPQMKPVIREFPLVAGTHVVMFTDGLLTAGQRAATPLDVETSCREAIAIDPEPQRVADAVLHRAMQMDQDQPGDDISVLVLAVLSTMAPDGARRFSVSFPI